MTRIKSIKKRSGEIVDFHAEKLLIAIQKAFVEVMGGSEESLLRRIVDHVIRDLEVQYHEHHENPIPHVEDVQNVVERTLMEEGLYTVAKAYIIYRYEHAKIRQEKKEEVMRKAQEGELFVTKRDGRKEPFSLEKLKASLAYVTWGYETTINIDQVIAQCRSELYDDISTKDIERTLIMVIRSFIEQDPAYSHVATRVLLWSVYKQVIQKEKLDFSNFRTHHNQAFVDSIKKGVAIGKLDPQLLLFDMEELARHLVLERDDLFRYLGLQTLTDRYFLQNPYTHQILETPQMFWMRVAMGLSIREKEREKYALLFYEVMSTLQYIPSTPTLFHAATIHPQLSSCYLTTVKDSLDHIFKCIGDNAQLSKWSGGVGNDWSYLRGTGALIRGTGVESQGVIPFLKIANDTTIAINRSGRRRGATCAYLETWHYDIEDFLELRKNTGDERRRTHDMNTAHWIPDLFIKRVREDKEWTLFSPEEVPLLHDLYGRAFQKAYEEYEQKAERGEINLFKKVRALDLWKKMLSMLFETGHPWITFKDSCNVRSPQDHVGVVHSSNLCTEITLNTSADETAVCNLGSLNLPRLMKNAKLDENIVEGTVKIAMRMLDNVIDINFYPTLEAERSNLRHRPVGLGIMGFQDVLYQQNIQFDSEECMEFADHSMEMISYYAILASSELAKERGIYQSFKGSKWDRGIFPQDTIALLEEERGMSIPFPIKERLPWERVRDHVKMYGMRNSNCLAIAPTATISNIVGSLPSIEPIYKNIYVKSNVSGDFIVMNSYLVEDLKRLSLWTPEMLGKIKYFDGGLREITEIPEELREKYKETFEIDPRWLMKIAAYRGRWIDQSQSLNIFFSGTSGKLLSEIYMYAWELGLKTTYYLRTLAASQVEKSTVDIDQFGVTHQRHVSPPSLDVIQSHVSIPKEIPIIAYAGMSIGNPGASSMKNYPEERMEESLIHLCKINDPDCEACQ